MALAQLPDEILHHILHQLPPDDALRSFQLVCRRFARLSAAPLVWRSHCVHGFAYWHPRHDFPTKLARPAADVDWKALYVDRRRSNVLAARLLDSIIATKVRRLDCFGRLGTLGYDAKDFLLEQASTAEDAHDVLARRYYARAVLASIHRSVGIDEWIALGDPDRPDPGLERVLGALDMFVLDEGAADIEEITRMLDERTAEFRASHANLDAQTTRQRALSLNRWVREHNLVGLGDPEHDYRNLRNCLIGQALRSPDHESIPIISCAIYTCIAQRVGLDAHCCNFPGHIHAVVQAPPGRTVDGEPMAPTARPDRICLDPFSDDNEVPLERLTSRLAAQGLASPAEAESFLGPARSVDILTRTGSNITATYVNVLERQDHDDASNLTRLLHSSSGSMNLISSLYASMWAELVSTPPETWAQLDFFLGRFARTWQEDAWLVERHLVPRSPTRRHVFGRHAGQSEDAWKLLRTLQRSDALPAPVFRRGPDAAEVPYRVGQVFRHTRYGYLGVITSWSNKGTRDLSQSSADDVREETTDTDVVNRLRLDSKNYYTYLRTSSFERYVIAEANIELVADVAVVDQDPFLYAGKFFQRFDRETCTFVSNIREQFPDD